MRDGKERTDETRTGDPRERNQMRGMEVARAGYGAALALRPEPLIRTVSGAPADRSSTAVARVLGGRHVAQALALGRSGKGLWISLGAAVDGLHALSMVALAALDGEHRRLASFDAAVASLFALGETLEARHA